MTNLLFCTNSLSLVSTSDKQSKDYTIRPKIVIPPRSRHTEIYRNLSLSCVTTSSVDKPITIKWYHNGQLLMNAKVTKSPAALQRIRTNLFMHTSTLVLNKVRYEEKGKYSCEAINIYGSVKSIAANVTIVGKFFAFFCFFTTLSSPK